MNSSRKQKTKAVAVSLSICLIYVATMYLWRCGKLQFLEFALYDQCLRWRAKIAPTNSPVVLIGINASDIDLEHGGYPVSDGRLGQLLDELAVHEPRVIGLDLYRDQPIPSDGKELPILEEALLRHTNVVVVQKFGNNADTGIAPPPVLKAFPDRIGFSDFPRDDTSGQPVRRGLLFVNDETVDYYSFSLRLALRYLEKEGVALAHVAPGSADLRLGELQLRPLESNDGGYVHADAGGFQVLLDFKGPTTFPTYSLTEVLNGGVRPEALREKIVIVGMMATGTKDLLPTPIKSTHYGAELHGQFADQLVRGALFGDKPLRFLPEWLEICLLILSFVAVAGVAIGGNADSLPIYLLAMALAVGLMLFASWLCFNIGLWISVAPLSVAILPSVALTGVCHFHTLKRLFFTYIPSNTAKRILLGRPDQNVFVTVLHIDIAGSSVVSRGREPKEFKNWLDEYYKKVIPPIAQRKGDLHDFAGDGLMASFEVLDEPGNEKQKHDQALQAVDAALAIPAGLKRLNDDLQNNGKPPITLRVGIFSGPAAEGEVGTDERRARKIFGDAVNTAALIEQYAKEITEWPYPNCRMLIAGSTWNLLKGKLEGELVNEVALKGQEEKVKVYKLKSRKV